MKKLLISLFIVVSCFYYGTTNAQAKLKIGYIDSNEMLFLMPESDSAKIKLEDHNKLLEKQLQTMAAEFEKKNQEFKALPASTSDLIKGIKYEELEELNNRIMNFKQQAEEDFQNKKAELFNPIVVKLKKAIEDVAKENAYTYVLDISSGAVLYFETGENIMPLVKKKLNIADVK